MNTNKKNLFQLIFGVLLAVFLLYLTLKGKDLNKIWETIKTTNILYLALAVFVYLLSFITRSEKWRIQVENLDYKVCPKSSYFAMMLHYFVNSFSPKLGVIARCSDLKKKNNVPFSACFGSYMSEVVFDTLFLFIGLFFVVVAEFDKIRIVFEKLFSDVESYLHLHQQYYIFVVFLVVIILSFIYIFKTKNYFRIYDNSLKTLIKSISKTFTIKKFPLFVLWNLILWLLLLAMNYFLFKSLFDYKINFGFLLTITTFTYSAWLMPTPGGIGSVEYFVLQAFLLFGLNAHDAISFGILSNGLTFLSVLIFTSFLLFFQQISKFFSPKDKLSS